MSTTTPASPVVTPAASQTPAASAGVSARPSLASLALNAAMPAVMGTRPAVASVAVTAPATPPAPTRSVYRDAATGVVKFDGYDVTISLPSGHQPPSAHVFTVTSTYQSQSYGSFKEALAAAHSAADEIDAINALPSK